MKSRNLYASVFALVCLFLFGVAPQSASAVSVHSGDTVTSNYDFTGLSGSAAPPYSLMRISFSYSGLNVAPVTFNADGFDQLNGLGTQILNLASGFSTAPSGNFNVTANLAGLVDGLFSIRFSLGGTGALLDLTSSASGLDVDSATLASVQGVPAATPLSAALPLVATGLGALGLLGWRRRALHAA